jgi:hypothetical protein
MQVSINGIDSRYVSATKNVVRGRSVADIDPSPLGDLS